MIPLRRVYSIGYERRSLDGLCDTLAAAGVKVLVDVRAAAWSQRPEFRKGRLQAALGARGIEYVHCKEAGNPHRPRSGEPRDLAACGEVYATHLRAHPEVMTTLRNICASDAALFCYEGHREHCHRGILLSSLASGGDYEVVDL